MMDGHDGRSTTAVELVGLESVKRHPLVGTYIRRADEHVGAMGFTEHGFRHAELVSHIAYNVLKRLGDPERLAVLAAIAGYTHDIGNVVGRDQHWTSGACIMAGILHELRMDPDEIAIVMGAIGNHEESVGHPVNRVSAAVILADKSDVHKTRVRQKEIVAFDIHDRVNYAVQRSFLNVDSHSHTITLQLEIDTSICPVMEYFEIFLSRMMICRKAADFLGCRFKLIINGATLL